MVLEVYESLEVGESKLTSYWAMEIYCVPLKPKCPYPNKNFPNKNKQKKN